MHPTNKLKILYVSAEVSPFAKTGGLADVAGSLPKALASNENDIRVVMPKYKSIKNPMKYITDFPVKMGDNIKTCIVRETETEVPVYFVDSYEYYYRDGIYCHFDDADRFTFFCNAVIEMLPHINFQPDIIHCNDWHTGPICMILKECYTNKSFYKDISTVYTIHNLEYQGNFPEDVINLFNVSKDVFTPDKVEYYGMFNFMKAGIVYADVINTVSTSYSEEIQTSDYGEGLEGLLRKRSKDLFGIVNGISYEDFDPSTDTRIYRNFDINSIELKKENKYLLQEELGLPIGDMPMMGLVSRLSGQKGLDLIIEKIDDIMKEDVQFVLLGTGDPYYESIFTNIKTRYPNKVAVHIDFNAALAQKIYAACDMFLMPSRFEPCGLGQIISLRYGTIPIVRATGGLAETILDFNEDEESGNGFSFVEFSSLALYNTIKRAISLYKNEPEKWQKLKERALSQDFSWDKSAKKYMDLYNIAIKKHNN